MTARVAEAASATLTIVELVYQFELRLDHRDQHQLQGRPQREEPRFAERRA